MGAGSGGVGSCTGTVSPHSADSNNVASNEATVHTLQPLQRVAPLRIRATVETDELFRPRSLRWSRRQQPECDMHNQHRVAGQRYMYAALVSPQPRQSPPPQSPLRSPVKVAPCSVTISSRMLINLLVEDESLVPTVKRFQRPSPDGTSACSAAARQDGARRPTRARATTPPARAARQGDGGRMGRCRPASQSVFAGQSERSAITKCARIGRKGVPNSPVRERSSEPKRPAAPQSMPGAREPAPANLNWRALALVSAATCTLTAGAILLLLDRRHFRSSRRRRSSRRSRRLSSSSSRSDSEKQDSTMPGEVVYLNNPNACLDYAVGAGGADEFDDAKFVVKQICSDWKDAPNDDISVKIIVGGITNRLYRLMWGDKSVLVRLYGDHTEEFIDRSIENMLFALLSERGFAPTYYGRFKNGRIEGWLDARPLEPEDMGLTHPINYLQMIGRELGIMHVMDIPEDRAPVLWTKIERFEKLALEIELEDPVKNAALEELDLAGLHQKLEWLKSVLPSNHNHNGKDLLDELDTDEISKQAEAFASDVVFSHNDLLSGNILHNPEWDRVQIIDYEYGGYNFRAFDFANHFCENCGFELDLALYPSIDKQFAFFKAYMSTAAPKMLAQLEANRESKAFFHALYDVVNRYALASHLFWGYWALVQAAHSKIDFDFLEYAGKRFNAFDVQREFFLGSS